MFDADSEFAAKSTAILEQRSWSFYRDVGKRAFDLIFVAAISPFLFPLIALLAFAVMLDGGSAIFGHKRVGKDGKTFICWKLRSMVPDAENRLRAYLLSNEHARKYWLANFKLVDDPRITKLGKFLRKTSLDELPQFWNVLIGDMALVGPRPVTRDETALYGDARALLETVRPGITGVWQVSGRNAIDYDDRVALDIKYLRLIDFPTDLSLIFKTVLVMVNRTGV